jgi:O-acetyl-ADP-ribose deacetylase (regulator of RNase III)
MRRVPSGTEVAEERTTCWLPATARVWASETDEIGSIAFLAISCGVYRFPIDRAADLVAGTVCDSVPSCVGVRRGLLVAWDAKVEAALKRALDGSLAGERIKAG